MKIGDKYVGLGSGDNSEEVRKIKAHMRRKYSYARSLADTTLYDDAMTVAVAEMQSRYEADGRLPKDKYLPGVIGIETKYVMGYLVRPLGPDTRPVLFTVCGTGVPWWVGPDADLARAVEYKYRWQPIGYRAAPFPMGTSVAEGRAELSRLIEAPENRNLPKVLCGYSQGAIVTSECWEYDIKPVGGRLHWAHDSIVKAVTFGNPMRQQGHAFADPGGPTAPPVSHGIADRLLTDTPPWWRDYAHQADLYTDCEGESGEDKTAIYKVVMGARMFSGPDSLLAQVMEILGVRNDAGRLLEITGIFKAVWDAGLFAVRKTGPHVNYSPLPAIDYLRAG